ncbi:unnamed protein product [Notodromas monacha]|uniref:Protein kinase domain-containing protein n=1 Tax=Notodromas monacha TaxID=399045 RepID=A0A7R9BWW1_9CRUS|nr:unnamed protein product [Notodromas monacha]CAG0923280.1 unnamed protein product [Notodromas monacha]
MILSSLLSLSPPDDYEVSWDQLILQEVLGEGAFGVVRKAHLKLNKKNRAQLVEQAALPESRTRHHHLPHRSKAGIEVVAVKMLKDGAGLEEYQQLKNEMEVLKMINHHPNVVGILGAVTQTRPMALIVEHCPFGDLHTQLRRMAEKMELEKARKIAEATERKGIVYTEFRCNASDSSGYEGCESETSSPPSTPPLNIPAGSAMVHNELYEGSLDNPQLVINSGGENIVCENYEVAIDNAPQNAVDEMRTPSDLLSIARQIAAGMTRLLYRTVDGLLAGAQIYSLMVECWKLPSAERPFFTDLKVSLDKMLEDSTTEEYLTLNPDPVSLDKMLEDSTTEEYLTLNPDPVPREDFD